MSLPNINDFKQKLLRGGARANYYRVVSPNIGGDEFTFLCRAASLPAAAVNVVEVKTPGGRSIKYSGERTFENWNITVYNDTNMVLRERFESWQTNSANWDNPTAHDNLNEYASTSGWFVSQLDRAGKIMRSYAFFNMWCANLGAIELTFDDAGSIEEFTCELAYSHYVPVAGTSETSGILQSIGGIVDDLVKPLAQTDIGDTSDDDNEGATVAPGSGEAVG